MVSCYFEDYHKKNVLTPYTFYPSMAIIKKYDSQSVLIICGIASVEMGFSPAHIKIGELTMSYYKQERSDDSVAIETDLKAYDNTDITEFTKLGFRFDNAHLSPVNRFINLLKVLNWCHPYYDAIDKEKIIKKVSDDYWFYRKKHELFLTALKDLKWQFEWSSRYKSGEGTLYDLYSNLALPENEYIKYIITQVVECQIRHADVSYSEKEIEKIGYNHLNKARVLTYQNFELSKYFLSLIRDYQKYPFGSIILDS